MSVNDLQAFPSLYVPWVRLKTYLFHCHTEYSHRKYCFKRSGLFSLQIGCKNSKWNQQGGSEEGHWRCVRTTFHITACIKTETELNWNCKKIQFITLSFYCADQRHQRTRKKVKDAWVTTCCRFRHLSLGLMTPFFDALFYNSCCSRTRRLGLRWVCEYNTSLLTKKIQHETKFNKWSDTERKE